MTPRITVAEWAAEIQRVLAQPRPGDAGVTIGELHALTHWTPQRIRDAIRTMPGLVVGKRAIIDLAGRHHVVPCYRIEQTKAAKRR